MSEVKRPKALVLMGEGILTEVEMAQALATAGFEVHLRHLEDLVREKIPESALYPEYRVVAIPGGSSSADHLGAGKSVALKLLHGLGWNFQTFAQKGGLVLGVGSGFQALVRMGAFGKEISLTWNAQGKTIQSWVKVVPNGTQCVWLRGLGAIDLPLRNGEARIVFHSSRRTEALVRMQRKGMNCLKYEGNIVGSEESLAGLCDPTGRIFGLMPHPESFVRWTAHPEWTLTPQRANAPGQGLQIFENAYQEAVRADQPAP